MENNNSSNNKIAHPILGIPQKAGDSYVVKDRAIVGLVYTLVCPKCRKHLLIKASSAKLNKIQCKNCGATIYYKGQENPSRPVPTQRFASDKNEEKEHNNSETQEPGKENELKEKKESKESAGTVKFSKPNVKFVWGNILRRKVYEIKHLGEYYIGRDDDEIKSDIMIADDYVSRRSVLLEVLPQAGGGCQYKITVKNASNPVLVNVQEITIASSTYLNYGDTILVGNTTLTFKRNDK